MCHVAARARPHCWRCHRTPSRDDSDDDGDSNSYYDYWKLRTDLNYWLEALIIDLMHWQTSFFFDYGWLVLTFSLLSVLLLLWAQRARLSLRVSFAAAFCQWERHRGWRKLSLYLHFFFFCLFLCLLSLLSIYDCFFLTRNVCSSSVSSNNTLNTNARWAASSFAGLRAQLIGEMLMKS